MERRRPRAVPPRPDRDAARAAPTAARRAPAAAAAADRRPARAPPRGYRPTTTSRPRTICCSDVANTRSRCRARSRSAPASATSCWLDLSDPVARPDQAQQIVVHRARLPPQSAAGARSRPSGTTAWRRSPPATAARRAGRPRSPAAPRWRTRPAPGRVPTDRAPTRSRRRCPDRSLVASRPTTPAPPTSDELRIEQRARLHDQRRRRRRRARRPPAGRDCSGAPRRPATSSCGSPNVAHPVGRHGARRAGVGCPGGGHRRRRRQHARQRVGRRRRLLHRAPGRAAPARRSQTARRSSATESHGVNAG